MKKIFEWLFLCIPFCLMAEEEVALNLKGAIEVPSLKGILFLGSWDQVRKTPAHPVYGVISDRVFLLDNNPSFLKSLADQYLGASLTAEKMEEIKGDVASLYKREGQPFVAINIPRQDLSSGILQVVVEEAKLGRVVTRGNQYYTPDQIRQFIQAKAGEPLDMKTLAQDLTRMNENPFRRTDAVVRAGKKPELVDLELATIDRWPYRLYMGGDNTGTESTDRDRLFFGFNFGKTVIRDSEISYQFTCAPNWNLFYAHTLSCRIPWPKKQTILLYGGYSQVEPKLSGDKEKGKSWQLDARYRIPLITNSSFLQELLLGYDFKQVSSRSKSEGGDVSREGADINQFMIGYDFGQKGKRHKVSFLAELYGNPGGITTWNHKENYEGIRYAAAPTYAYLKISHSLAARLNDLFWFSYDINGQVATRNLLPSEQLTLTGYQAVRGFEERIVNVDNGILLNTSLETVNYSLGKAFGLTKKAFDELHFLIFFDAAWGGNHQPAPGESSLVYLASVGPGIKYQIDRWFSAHFDYGFQLYHHGFKNPTDSRYNFGLMMSY